MDEALLPLAPWAAAAVGLVLLAGLQAPAPRVAAREVRAALSPVASRGGALGLVVVLLLLAVGARLGSSELSPVPALVVGLGGPLLLVVPALLPRLSGRPRAGGEPSDVRPSVPLAVAVVGYLVLVPAPGRPAVLGSALAGYALVVVALAVALGRGWAARAEPLGLLVRWAALGPRLTRWVPPRGAAAVLALVLAGAWTERAQRTALWAAEAPPRSAAVLLLGLAVALAAALSVPLRHAGAAAVLLPLAAGAAAGGGARRALISAQLLGGGAVDPDPLGVAGGQGLALALVTVGGLLAAVVLARRSGPGAARLPGLGAVLGATLVSAVLVLQP